MIASSPNSILSATDSSLAVPIGEPVIAIIKRAYEAGLPFLLEGAHGVGKSLCVHEAARQLDLPVIERDLSILESSDIAGVPYVDREGKFTKFAPPDFLPKPSQPRGLLLLEELNRSSESTRHAALQILTARRIHDFELAPGWVPCTTINSREVGKYQVFSLCPALLSRFVRVRVKADPVHWLAWARGAGGVHPVVTEYISLLDSPFEDAEGNPRSWTYVSRLIRSVPDPGNMDEPTAAALAASIAGLVGGAHASAVMRMLLGTEKPLSPKVILEDPAGWLATVRRWRDDGRLDVLSATLRQVLRYVRPQTRASAVIGDARRLENLKQFFRELPPDMAAAVQAFIVETSYVAMDWQETSPAPTSQPGSNRPHHMIRRLNAMVDASRARNAANSPGNVT